MRRQALIVGGGIGGLCAAISLSLTGWDVQVFEQAPEITEIGAGLQISPNGVKILEHIGVMERLNSALFEPEAIEIRMGVSGSPILYLPMKNVSTQRWGARYIQVHRADLITALSARLDALQRGAVQTGCPVRGYAPCKDGAEVILTNGRRIKADLVIGADGIHSSIRHQMLGLDAPRFTGNYAWRALVPAAQLGALAPPPSGCIWAGPKKHAVTTYVRGGSVVNFVGIVEQTIWREESWSHTGDRQEALADFGDWAPPILAILEQAKVLHKWALFDRAPLPKWHEGHVVILGDAAHPMLPSMAQGAVQSLEDAFHLARALGAAEGTDIAAACAQHYAQRIARTSRVQRVSAKNLELFHKSSRLTQLMAYAPIWLAGQLAPSLVHRRNDWLYGAPVPPLNI
jgi:salicylate hydroxylase